MINRIKNIIIFSLIFSVMTISYSFASKYTIASGKDFNARIKMYFDKNNTSATADYHITAFKYSSSLDGTPIDISEDGDSSILAYIKNNIIYCVSDDDVYLNQDASFMFDKFVNIKQVDLSFFNFSKTKKTSFMFGNCKYLTNINLDNDMDIHLTDMEGMFFDCQSLVDLDIHMIDTNNVRNMNSLFFNCKNIKNIYVDRNNWSVKKVNNINKMYYNCAMLRTNLNRKAIDIEESNYKLYSRPGDDDIEGLLKDIDFDYDDYGKNTGSFPVDKTTETLVSSPDNKNSLEYITASDIQKSKELSAVNISTDSSLYSQNSEMKIDKFGRKKFSDYLISQTVDDVPILAEETTFVDYLIPKKKNKGTVSSAKRIVDEENEMEASDVKGLLRPSYDSVLDEESATDNNKTLDDVTFKESPIISDLTIAVIIILVIVIITSGIFAFYFKNKKDSFDSWS